MLTVCPSVTLHIFPAYITFVNFPKSQFFLSYVQAVKFFQCCTSRLLKTVFAKISEDSLDYFRFFEREMKKEKALTWT